MIKRILVYTYGDRSHLEAIEAAAGLAAEQQATIIGLFVKPDFARYATVYGNLAIDLSASFGDLQNDFSNKAKLEFEEIVSKHKLNSQWHVVDQFEPTPKPSNYADLIFVSQPRSENSVVFDDTDFVDYLITDTGLPTIVIPNGWKADHFGKYPTLGWKECREAVGAVRHALPLMRAAENVDIVTVKKYTDLNEELVEGIEISEYLAEHGVEARYTTLRMTVDDRRASSALLRHVREQGRDLIIIGGYSHSRLRELVLGGMTRTLIKDSEVPVLLSH